ncbi:MAG TPA: PAS domain S-box protein [Dongiaceae bacterium]|nr:PAS domain S-box protein [Dongiaceae bacterium]
MSAVDILIADDHAAFRRNLRSLLETRSEWRVCAEASDGEEAVLQAIKLRPQIILMDVSMPRMDGIQASRIIRQRVPESNVIIVSQNDPAVVSRQAAEVGAASYISKQSMARELFPAIERFAKRNGNSRATERSVAPSLREGQATVTLSATPPNVDCLAFPGEMAALMRSIDWSKTPVGPAETWPQSLKTALSILLTQKTPVFIFWGPEHVQFYNDAYRPILGTSKHPSAMGQCGRDCWKEIWEIIEPMLDAVHRGESTSVTDGLLVIDRNGYLEEFYFNYAYNPIRDESGSVGGVFCVVYDTTQRVIGERRLKTLRDLATHGNQDRTVEEACKLAAATLDSNRYDVPFASLYLYDEQRTKASLVACSGISRASPARPEVVALSDNDSALARAAVSNQLQTIELKEVGFAHLPDCPWPDPPNSAVVLPIASPDKSAPDGFAFVGINPRKRLDADYETFLKLAFGHIGNAIAAARAFEEERKRSEALAELDRAKTLFFSNVSHEFRTPLTLMLGPLEDTLSAHGRLASEDRERLELAHRNSLRLLKLVNTLLDFSRIEAGRIEACYEPTDLCRLTLELASVFRSAIERAGLHLVTNCEQLTEPVFVDREMWEKIVFNLLSNALKFTFAGEVEISLKKVDGSVQLAVRDTGTGIPAHELPHLFERFFRVKGAHGRTLEGSGIGLAFVQELVKLHAGTVHVDSKENAGSTFFVTIPLGKDHLPADRIGASRTSVSTGTRGEVYVQEALRWFSGTQETAYETSLLSPALDHVAEEAAVTTGRRILLADDNADMREYVHRLLQRHYEVVATADGQAALESAREHRPDLILADVMMPRLDGFGLLREVRADEALNGTPVVLLSARAGEESRIEGLTSGADDYLVKPFSARELLARISSHLALAKVRRESAELERKLRAQAELERNRLHELFMQAPAAIGLLSGPEHRFTFVNRDYVKLTGRRGTEDFVGRTVREAFPELEGQGIFELLDGVYRTGAPYAATARQVVLNRGPQGQPEEVYFDFIYQPMRDATGEVEGILVHAVEVTQQVLARQEIEKRERQFREMIDALPAAIYTTDAQGRLTHFNPAAVEFSGRTPELGTDQWCVSWKLFYPDGRPMPHDECPMAIALKEGRVIKGAEAIAQRQDGTRRWFTPYPTVLRDDQGNIVGGINMLVDITARKQAEEATAHLAAIVSSSDDAILSKTLDGVIRSWNQSAERLFGYSAKEAIGKHITIIVPSDRRTEENNILSRLRRGERIDHFETIRMRKDGSTFDVSLTISPIKDSAGRVIGASNVARDISHLKRIERALRDSEERFRAIVDTTPECVKLVAQDGTLLHMNSSGLAMVGAESPTQVVGKSIYDLIAHKDRERFRELNQSVCSGKKGALAFDIVRLDGECRHMETQAAPLRNPDGTIVQLAVTRDVTERKRAQETLRQSEERLRALVKASSYVVYRMSPDWSEMRQLDGLGFISDTPKPTKDWLQQYIYPDDQPVVLETIAKAIESKSVFELEHRVLRVDGTLGWTVSRAVPLLDKDGEITEWFGAATNVTARKVAEESYRKLAETLEAEVRAQESWKSETTKY